MMAAKVCNFIIGCIFFAEKMKKSRKKVVFGLKTQEFYPFVARL